MSSLGERAERVGGIVLCGGKSSRMGTAKADLDFAGETMLARICRTLNEVVSPVVVVAAPEQQVPAIPIRITVVRDPVAYDGPLRGIAEGLAALPADVDAAYVTSCDVPLLTVAWIRFLIGCLGDADIAVPHVNGRPHPLSGVYRQATASTARRLLGEGRFRPAFLFDLHPTRFVTADELTSVDPALEALLNVNTPEEYTALRSRFSARS